MMADQPKFIVTSGGQERVERTAEVLAPAFEFDPIFRWELHNFSLSDQRQLLPKIFRSFFVASAMNDGLLIEADDFAACAVLMPPGKDNGNPWTLIPAGLIPFLFTVGPGACKRIVLDYPRGNKAAMATVLTEAEQKAHWYTFIMGTASDRRRQGLGSALLEYMQDKSRSDGRPLWIEATTVLSRDLYKKHGFTIVDEFKLGKEHVDENGLAKKGGEGVTVWPMVWRP